MRTVTMRLPSAPSVIRMGSDLLPRIGEEVLRLSVEPATAAVVADETCACYARVVAQSLRAVGFTVSLYRVPSGERIKSLSWVKRLYTFFLKARIERISPVFAVGGGVVGDVVGFAASTYKRGVPFFQVPTTLLAQVDASIGGKTAVNLRQGKNLVGTFYQPRGVFIDPTTLSTLVSRDFLGGLGEVVKYAMISKDDFFNYIKGHRNELLARRPGVLEVVISRCVAIKARVVEHDERETAGKRAVLNYGHTVGHAVEAAGGFRRFHHGEAVAVGMEAEARMAVELGLASEKVHRGQRQLLESLGLPVMARGLSLDRVLQAMHVDKKMRGGRLRFALPTAIGRVVYPVEVPLSIIGRAVRSVMR